MFWSVTVPSPSIQHEGTTTSIKYLINDVERRRERVCVCVFVCVYVLRKGGEKKKRL